VTAKISGKAQMAMRCNNVSSSMVGIISRGWGATRA
jgi:hypothetical protein